MKSYKVGWNTSGTDASYATSPYGAVATVGIEPIEELEPGVLSPRKINELIRVVNGLIAIENGRI